MALDRARLSSDEKAPLYTDDEHFTSDVKAHRRRGFLGWPIAILLIVSLGLNLAQFVRALSERPSGRKGEVVFSNIPYDVSKIYRDRTDYWGTDEKLADKLWEELNTDPVAIALHDDYVREKGLPPADRFPWDDDKGVYYIKAFHDLHCLKLMRKYTRALLLGEKTVIDHHHYEHCLDALRQDIMCKADDTPMQGYAASGGIGNGQTMQCRDWNQLVAWSQAPERNACYRRINDYNTNNNTLERLAFCPEWSPYRDVSQAYFKKWGHHISPEDELPY